MMKIFRTMEEGIRQINEIQEGCWVALSDPTASELLAISTEYGIDIEDLRAPLDEEERSRIEVEDDYTLILVDIPAVEIRHDKQAYTTIPLGIILKQDLILYNRIVCSKQKKF